MEKSLHFYCDIAGLTKAFDIHDDNDKPWIVYLKVSDGQFLELFHDGVKVPENRYAPDLIGYHHFCFETDNIEELAKRFHANGLMTDDKPGHGKDLNYNCWIHDPDGNAVELGKDLNYQCWTKDPDGFPIEFMQLDPRSPQVNS
ncbi:VOC family protein [Paenibacillus alkaliterrae]|uniref:VOC family protein n=1 Tax=Paenibacillus alkaliterrae TaxID=320909 RepID=UPI001F24A514|nr:VOC family protein [Paenibacillus alkaliterrae]MCF2939157.1 VOC family protein [Paenibacillus alkaliterrae]